MVLRFKNGAAHDSFVLAAFLGSVVTPPHKHYLISKSWLYLRNTAQNYEKGN